MPQAAVILEQYFEFSRFQTTWKTEVLAGFTTFLTMAYIVAVNPAILHDSGMPTSGVFAATCLSAAFASILMGAVARYPIALAPGMGLNAYFTYSVVKGMGIPWETALGAVFLSGVAFLLLTATGVRQLLLTAIPPALFAALTAGIGLFIAFLGLRNAGIVQPDPATLVTMGNLRSPNTALALFGVLLIVALQAAKVRFSILAGMAATTVLAAAFGLVRWQPQPAAFADLSSTFFRLNIRGALNLGFFEIIFVFLFVDLFDNIGTLVAVSRPAGLIGPDGSIPRINRILFTDAAATVIGSVTGTTTVTSYIESAAGVAAGGRTGVAAVVTGLLFALTLFLGPLVSAVPPAATAAALIVVGGLMLSSMAEIPWDDACIAFPAFLTLVAIPLTFSIANGLGLGIVSYVILHAITGRARQVPLVAYGLALLLIARFFYMGGHA